MTESARQAGAGAAKAALTVTDLLEGRMPSLEELMVRPEILEAAEEICARSDVLGIERSEFERLVRIIVWGDRVARCEVSPKDTN